MLVARDERHNAALLFALLKSGEVVAEHVAKRQAKQTDGRARAFLRGQARQEAFHAHVFSGAIRVLRPKGVVGNCEQQMRRYRRLLDDALDRGDLAESLVGQQVVLEALGEVLLTAIDQGIERRGLGFRRMRKIILAQERAHHSMGDRLLLAMLRDAPEERERLRAVSEKYLSIVEDMYRNNAQLLSDFGEDPDDHWQAIHEALPAWVKP